MWRVTTLSVIATPMERSPGCAPLTLADLADAGRHRWGGQPFLEVWSSRLGPSAVSFESFALLVESAVALLLQHGAVRGSKLAVLCHPCPDSLALSLAMTSLGGIVVNLNWRHPEDTLQQLLLSVGCELMVTGRGLAATAQRLCEATGNVNALLVLEQSEAELQADGAPSTAVCAVACGPGRSTLLSAGAANPRLSRGGEAAARPEPDDVAVVMFTSGTSALPKAVPLTHRNLLWSCNAKVRGCNPHPGCNPTSELQPQSCNPRAATPELQPHASRRKPRLACSTWRATATAARWRSCRRAT